MTIEPSIAATARRLETAERTMLGTAWIEYRACPACKATTGNPCVSLSGYYLTGLVLEPIPMPHKARKRRTNR